MDVELKLDGSRWVRWGGLFITPLGGGGKILGGGGGKDSQVKDKDREGGLLDVGFT